MYITGKDSSVRLGGYSYRPYSFVIAPTSFEESAPIENLRGEKVGGLDGFSWWEINFAYGVTWNLQISGLGKGGDNLSVFER